MRREASEDNDTAVGPTSASERLPALDVLRGFALLGLLMLNIQDFASPADSVHDISLDVVGRIGPHHQADLAIFTIQWLFFEGKMRALFAALFGAGTALLLDRLETRRGASVAADIFHRRNMWLLLFGLIHGALLWYGDILLYYGSLALLLLYPLRNVAGRRLVVIGLAVSLVGGGLGIATVTDMRDAWTASRLQEGARDAQLRGQSPTREQARATAAAAAERRKQLAALPKAVAAAHVSYLQGLPATRRTRCAA